MPFVPDKQAGGFVPDTVSGPAAPQRTLPESIGRQVALTGREAIAGSPPAALGAMIGDALGMHSSEALNHFLTMIGFPEPASPMERAVAPIAESMAGAGGVIKGGQTLAQASGPVAKQVGEVLSSQPIAQLVGAGTGAASSEGAKALGGGPVAQTAAGLLGATAPAAVSAAIPAGVRQILRGSASKLPEAKATLGRYKEMGVSPTPGQIYKTGPGEATEAYLARSPGGHKTLRDFALKQAGELETAVEKQASALSEKSSPMMAGRAIEEGITGPGGFTDTFRKTSQELYDRLDSFVPQNLRVPVVATRNALDELNAPIPGAPKLSKFFQNARMQGIREALIQDTTTQAGAVSQLGPVQQELLGQLAPAEQTAISAGLMDGKLPYVALKKLRTLVGNELSDSSLVGDVPRSKWRALYAALSKDMESAVNATGDPAAIQSFKRANAYTKAGHDRMDSVLKPIIDRDAPEKIFAAAMAGTKQGDTTIHSVMQSLPPAQQKILASTVLRKLGLAIPSKQGAEGNTFSVSRFLTNWSSDVSRGKAFSIFKVRSYIHWELGQDLKDCRGHSLKRRGLR